MFTLVGDLRKILETGQTIVAFNLAIANGSFLWPGDLKLTAQVYKKGRLLAELPMRYALVPLVDPTDPEKLKWLRLSQGQTEVLSIATERISPSWLKDPALYRIYGIFPERAGDEEWNPYLIKDVVITAGRSSGVEMVKKGE